jgi:hypothetical protein
MARKERKFHYIYRITNTKNNRYYIGMHSTDDLEDGYMGSGKRIRNSIRKHGLDAHTKEILEFLDNRRSLAEREKEIVNESLLQNPLCMNLQPGGGGGISSKEHLKNLNKGSSIYMKNKWKNPDYRENMSRDISKKSSERMKDLWKDVEYRDTFKPFLGKNHKEETILLMKEKKKGYGIGESNSQFSTIWITDEIENKKIKKTDIIPEGWRNGRFLKNK